jgi:multidrug efflux pump subunit AcrA (membrane-fusion protein)
MSTTAARQDNPVRTIESLLELLAERGDEPGFHDRYAHAIASVCRADVAIVIGVEPPAPVLRGAFGAEDACLWLFEHLPPDLLAGASRQGYSHDTLRRQDALSTVLLAVSLLDDVASVLVMALPERERAHLKEALVRAMLVKDIRRRRPAAASPGAPIPGAEQDTALALPSPDPAGSEPGAHQARLTATGRDVPALSSAGAGQSMLDLLSVAAEVMQAPRFNEAALALVNGVTSLFRLRQAALVWREAGRAELVTVSHVDRFERTSRMVQALQGAALEVLSTDSRVRAWRVAEHEDAADTLLAGPPAHQMLLGALGDAPGVVSVPVRNRSGMAEAVLVCVLGQRELADEDIDELTAVLDMVHPALAKGRLDQSWWGRRWRLKTLGHLELLFGPGHPWIKAAAVVGSAAVLFMAFGTLPYRIEASAQLATDSTRVVTAPNDGRLLEVSADIGDLIRKDQTLARLDVADLRQQELEVGSEIRRYLAEEDKARAAGSLAEAQVARFRREQSQARIKRVQALIEQADAKAPFGGVIVEGERRNLLGSTVRRGDLLFRVAAVDGLYVVMQVPERDIRDLPPRAQGNLILLTQTSQLIRFRVTHLVPMAQVKGEEGNQFVVKAQIIDTPEGWWRPGMTGLAKIDVGQRNVAWILFHRLFDTLRLYFWW